LLLSLRPHFVDYIACGADQRALERRTAQVYAYEKLVVVSAGRHKLASMAISPSGGRHEKSIQSRLLEHIKARKSMSILAPVR
jgi:hypothetical protein